MNNLVVKEGAYVQIHKIVLSANERSPQVPVDTSKVPLEMFVKGFLLNDAILGEQVKIKTVTNRIEEGTLIDAKPTHHHNFGDYVPEVITMSRTIKNFMDGDEV